MTLIHKIVCDMCGVDTSEHNRITLSGPRSNTEHGAYLLTEAHICMDCLLKGTTKKTPKELCIFVLGLDMKRCKSCIYFTCDGSENPIRFCVNHQKSEY